MQTVLQIYEYENTLQGSNLTIFNLIKCTLSICYGLGPMQNTISRNVHGPTSVQFIKLNIVKLLPWRVFSYSYIWSTVCIYPSHCIIFLEQWYSKWGKTLCVIHSFFSPNKLSLWLRTHFSAIMNSVSVWCALLKTQYDCVLPALGVGKFLLGGLWPAMQSLPA